MTFVDLLTDAKTNSTSQEQILEMYKPLLIKESIYDGAFDEDLCGASVLLLFRRKRTVGCRKTTGRPAGLRHFGDGLPVLSASDGLILDLHSEMAVSGTDKIYIRPANQTFYRIPHITYAGG